MYVGVTKQPLLTKLKSGLLANGKNGYKWKYESKIELFVYNFKGLIKEEVEAIESEIVFNIRQNYGKWPLFQNEIHLNNHFDFGIVIGRDIISSLQYNHAKYAEIKSKVNTNEIFKKPFQFGFRGDSYLWRELEILFAKERIKNEEDFEQFLVTNIERIISNKLEKDKSFFIKKYNFGGLSGGSISCNFWIEKGIPLLKKQYKQKTANNG